MNAVTTTLEKYQQLIQSQQSQLPGSDLPWLRAHRELAIQRFLQTGFPTRKNEAWRYTSLDSLLSKTFAVPGQNTGGEPTKDIFQDSQKLRIVLVNGRYSPQLSQLGGLPKGIYVASLQQTMAERGYLLQKMLERSPQSQFHVFNELNTAMLADGMVFYVEKDVTLPEPLELIYVASEGPQSYVMSPRNLIWLESGARATLVERYAGEQSGAYFTNGVGEVVVNAGAQLEHYRLQEESPGAYHISTLFVHQEANSRYQGNTVVLGSGWSRTDYNVDFHGENAYSRLDGLYLVKDKQLADIHLNINHAVPHCSSEQDFRGVLLGTGRGVFDGLIHVAQQAQKTEAHLHNANLMLSRNAEVDTKPQLLIYADDVKCSHGTTVGQLEPEQLFYLRSRGIREADAKKMLCVGFAQSVLENCSVESVRQRAEASLSEALHSNSIAV